MDHTKLLILTELGDNIGYGHFSRCSAIQEFAETRNLDTSLYVDIRGDTFPQGDFITCDWQNNWEKLLSTPYYYILVDSYLVEKKTISQIRNKSSKLVLLDDYYRLFDEVDLIINPNIFYQDFNYKTNSVGGKDFIILRDAFRKEHRRVIIRGQIESVFISLGGSDYRNLLPGIVQCVSKLFPQLKLYIVTGNEQYEQKLINKFMNYSSFNFYGFLNAYQIKNLMLGCDIAISACGQTLHELAYLGLPTIGVCIDEDQELNMLEYCKLGFLDEPRYWHQEKLLDSLNVAINKYENFELRTSLSQIGRNNVNSNGVENIIGAIYGI